MTLFDTILISTLVCSAVWGLFVGITGMVFIILSAGLAGFSLFHLDTMMELMQTLIPSVQWRMVSTLSVILLVIGLVARIAKTLIEKLVSQLHLGIINRLLGAIFAASVFGALALIGLAIALRFDLLPWEIWENAYTQPYVVEVLKELHKVKPEFAGQTFFTKQ